MDMVLCNNNSLAFQTLFSSYQTTDMQTLIPQALKNHESYRPQIASFWLQFLIFLAKVQQFVLERWNGAELEGILRVHLGVPSGISVKRYLKSLCPK